MCVCFFSPLDFRLAESRCGRDLAATRAAVWCSRFNSPSLHYRGFSLASLPFPAPRPGLGFAKPFGDLLTALGTDLRWETTLSEDGDTSTPPQIAVLPEDGDTSPPPQIAVVRWGHKHPPQIAVVRWGHKHPPQIAVLSEDGDTSTHRRLLYCQKMGIQAPPTDCCTVRRWGYKHPRRY